MKCPLCWSDKAYLRKISGWRGLLLDCLLMQPMKCHHCYHRFVVFWFKTIGKRVKPPLRSSRCGRQAGLSPAAPRAAAGTASGQVAKQRDEDRAASSAVC